MGLLLSCQNLSKTYADRVLFDGVSFGIEDRQRIGLLGPNGSGKTTLLRLLAGEETPDKGQITRNRSTRIGYLPQKNIYPADQTLEAIVLNAIKGSFHDEYEAQIEAYIILGKLGFNDPTQLAGTLSGGWNKRLALATVLGQNCDLLLLDEPTNHLDLEGIIMLEETLMASNKSFLLISHDRQFLENVTNRTFEINRRYPQGLFAVNGNYSEFLIKREEFFANQDRQEEVLANRVRREVDWLRRGPKARTTKAQGRITQAENLIADLEELKKRNNVLKTAELDFTSSGRKTKNLVVADGVAKKFGDKTLYEDVSFILSPGVRMGLCGPNGSGKTTLLHMIEGKLKPDAGTLTQANFLKVVTFDQKRKKLDDSLSLKRFLAPDGDQVIYRGESVHIITWAKKFLFGPRQLDTPVNSFSGGEQARIFISKLMLEEADLLLLDEPTNDLDIETLEVLEESLAEFPGALVLVSHDRYFLDRVCNRVLGLNGRGTADHYADYYQWDQAVLKHAELPEVPKEKKEPKAEVKASPKTVVKLSYKEQREYDQMEQAILKAEEKVAACEEAVKTAPTDVESMTKVYGKLSEAQKEVEVLYARWEELSAKSGQSTKTA